MEEWSEDLVARALSEMRMRSIEYEKEMLAYYSKIQAKLAESSPFIDGIVSDYKKSIERLESK
jgi:hypothetical protein